MYKVQSWLFTETFIELIISRMEGELTEQAIWSNVNSTGTQWNFLIFIISSPIVIKGIEGSFSNVYPVPRSVWAN